MHSSRVMSRAQRDLVIPRIEERVGIAKATRPRERVRVVKRIESHEVEVAVEAVEEDVEIERVPVNEYVAEPPRARVEGDVLVVPVVEEIVVVEKRLLLKEEIHVKKKRRVVRKKLHVPLRKERIAVERNGTSSTTEKEKRRSA